ncbi:hypothetical protein NX09_13670 [Xanthomonas vasicola]|nr:hypothetical protein NX07_13270 [Xanthomonas vasicola]KGR54035.1 hypothetical protein NX09_13670 [Xanthomonas vasicola]
MIAIYLSFAWCYIGKTPGQAVLYSVDEESLACASVGINGDTLFWRGRNDVSNHGLIASSFATDCALRSRFWCVVICIFLIRYICALEADLKILQAQ